MFSSSRGMLDEGPDGRAMDLTMLSPSRAGDGAGGGGGYLGGYGGYASTGSGRGGRSDGAGSVSLFVSETDREARARADLADAELREANEAGELRGSIREVRFEANTQAQGVADELARVKGELQARFDMLTAMVAGVQADKATDTQRILAELQAVRAVQTQPSAVTVTPHAMHRTFSAAPSTPGGVSQSASHDLERKLARLEAELAVLHSSHVAQESSTLLLAKSLRADTETLARRAVGPDALARLAAELRESHVSAADELARGFASELTGVARRLETVGDESRTTRAGLLLLEENALARFEEVDAGLRALRAEAAAGDGAIGGALAEIERVMAGRLADEAAARQAVAGAVAGVQSDTATLRAEVDALKVTVARLEASQQTRVVTESELARALGDLELRLGDRCDAQLLVLQRSLGESQQQLHVLDSNSRRLAAAHDELANATSAQLTELATRVSQTTHVSVANDIAFRAMRDKLGALSAAVDESAPLTLGTASASGARIAGSHTSRSDVASAEIERFLRSIGD